MPSPPSSAQSSNPVRDRVNKKGGITMTGVKAVDVHTDEHSCLSQRACVVRISEVAPGVKQFELRGAAGSRLLPFSAGAHVVITIRDQDRVLRNPYSIMGTLPEGDGYVISVRNAPESRGGSWFLHNRVQVDCELEISSPINNFAVANGARRHVLIAGGMGITPMLAMLEELQRDKANVELHYAVRSEIDGRFVSKLPSDVTRVTQIYQLRPRRAHSSPVGSGRAISRIARLCLRAAAPDRCRSRCGSPFRLAERSNSLRKREFGRRAEDGAGS